MFQQQFHDRADYLHEHFARGFFRHGFGRHGFFGHGGPGRGFRRHGFSNRPNVKYEILAVLFDGPRHGYDIMLAIEERRGGLRPSPGSIYPALQMLEDAEFIHGEELDGKRVYTITEKGSEYLAQHKDVDDSGPTQERDAFRETLLGGAKSFAGLKNAIKHVMLSHDPELIEKANEIIDRARRELYTLLAEETA